MYWGRRPSPDTSSIHRPTVAARLCTLMSSTLRDSDPKLAVQWKRTLSRYRGFKIGINWQGNPQYRGDRHRSIPISIFLAVFTVAAALSFHHNFADQNQV